MTETVKNNTEKKRKGFGYHLKIIFILYLISFGLLYFIYGVSQKYYKANASILQPLEREIKIEKGASDYMDKLLSQVRTNTDLFFSILTSRRMKDDIIERFNLVNGYRVSNVDHAREILNKRVSIYLTKEKVIEISVVDTDPKRSAEVANFFIERLDYFIQQLAVTAAKQDRIFTEKRLKETENVIASLENQLSIIKHRNKLAGDKDLTQIAQTAGSLMEELFKKRLELKREKEVLKEDSFEIEMLKKEITSIEETISGLLSSESELIKILRELKAQESVYSLLTSKLEEAKINEARDTPVIQVLDSAAVPARIYKPDIRLMLIVQAIIFGGLGIFVLFFDLMKYLGSI